MRRRSSLQRATITRLGHHGDGVAAGPLYVPRTLPEEVVEGEPVGDRLNVARIVEPSPYRVTAPCPHYNSCGGCSLQHAENGFVALWKAEVVRTALDAVDIRAPIRHIHTSPPFSRRRAVFSGRRTKKAASVGFHAPQSDQISVVTECLLVRPAISAIIPALAEIVRVAASRKGEVKLSVTDTETGLDLAITGGKDLDLALRQVLIQISLKAKLARLTWDEEVLATHAKPVLTFGTTSVTPPPGAFIQATAEGEAAIFAAVLEVLDGASDPVVDLFSGCGTLTFPIAQKFSVHAVEGEQEMLFALGEGWRKGSELKTVTTERRDLFRRPLLADELAKFGSAVIDPPRAGASAQTQELARSRISRIAFVSCNPTTFARDAAILIGAGFRMNWLDVVDQFRWSPHVELVAAFER